MLVIASSRREAGAPVRLLADGDLFADMPMRSLLRSAYRDDEQEDKQLQIDSKATASSFIV
ncbi:MAG: hypothetical protein Q9P90_04800 [candidate division KSB1 bacterium]|nr:hypothetical protein [candidate division KSB1 bacterium]